MKYMRLTELYFQFLIVLFNNGLNGSIQMIGRGFEIKVNNTVIKRTVTFSILERDDN